MFSGIGREQPLLHKACDDLESDLTKVRGNFLEDRYFENPRRCISAAYIGLY